ncbi:hypothetical protein [Vibrio sp. SCSIO 43136]|uniref:hypothetical protein n=1 Tax=Vibrio sp. SCSIO 43136 TaxID=2819101 RepID=UPI002074F319|nr:hypothetical protein [Vibrio sp. SCSIO 43136]USD67411.1 hypothetical protein J4N39_22555 [Vibrio sp. SCSIO 43136]
MRVHGLWRIQPFSDALLVAQVFDSWNQDAFIEFSKELEASIGLMNKERWAYIGDTRDWGLAVPDSQTPLEELYLGVKNLVCNVTVVSTSIQQTVIDRMKTPEEATIAPHFFANTIDDTLDILEQHDIHVDRKAVHHWFEQGR